MADKLVKCEAAWEKFFEKADVNSDGSVSIEELKHILTVEYNQKLSDREIAEMFMGTPGLSWRRNNNLVATGLYTLSR